MKIVLSQGVITVKHDKSVKIALDSCNLHDSCIKRRPHRDRTVQLFTSKIDLGYAYGQMKLSEEMSRQCLFATDGTKLSGLFQFRIRFYGLASLPTFQGKIHRTVEYSTPAWMNDIIVVTRGSKQDHEQKLFEVLSKLRNAGYRLGKRNPNSS